MEDTVMTSEKATTSSFPTTLDTQVVCCVCQKKFSQYTCPRCNCRYCSLQCYKKVLSGNQVSLEDLAPEELKKFQRAVASGELSKVIEPWNPWWLMPSTRRISLSHEGTQLVTPVHTAEQMGVSPEASTEANSCEIPPGPQSPLTPIKRMVRGEPSPLLTVHLVDIIYTYRFTLRLYNGDWNSSALDAAMVILGVSSVLGDDGQPEGAAEALAYCMEQTCSMNYRHAGGLLFGLILIGDVISLLSLGGAALVCSLRDLQRLIQAGDRELKSEKQKKAKRGEMSKA